MGLNLFQLACFHEALETVEVLLDCGVNPNVLPERETPMGRLPLYLALRKNNLRLLNSCCNGTPISRSMCSASTGSRIR